MSRSTLYLIIGGVVALLLVLTTVPLISDARVKAGSATAVATVDPLGAGNPQDCIDVTFDATISYTAKRPVINLFGFARAQDIVVDPAQMEVAARPECLEAVGSVEATAYLNAPVCGGGLCEGAYLDYMAGQGDDTTTSHMNYDGERPLPGSDLVRNEWCLEFAADVAYVWLLGGAVSESARVTDSDLCLDLS